jgi:glycogen synthase
MRILAVGNMYPPHHLGGYELVWQGAMQRARAAGNEVRVLTSAYRRPGVAEPDEDGTFRALPSHWSWERREWVRLGALGRLRFELRSWWAMRRQLRDFRPDVVTWWPMGGLSLGLIERARRRGVPSVLVVHDDWLVYGRREDAWLRIWQGRRRVLGRVVESVLRIPTTHRLEDAGRYLFNSAYVRDEAARAGIRPPDSDVVHPGIDPRFLEAEAAERDWSWRLGCIGRIEVQKGVDTAVAALAHLPRASLSVIGEGHPDYVAELRDQAERLGVSDRVDFLPSRPPVELPRAYTELDALIFPVHWSEPWGLVPLEAMAVGRPVISTARGGPREYLRDGGNALVVPAKDPLAIAAAVERLAGDAELRRRLREHGRSTAERYTAPAFERRIVAELEAAASGRAA